MTCARCGTTITATPVRCTVCGERYDRAASGATDTTCPNCWPVARAAMLTADRHETVSGLALPGRRTRHGARLEDV